MSDEPTAPDGGPDPFSDLRDGNTDDPREQAHEPDTPTEDDGDDEPLRPEGKKALEAEKARRKAEAERRRAAEKQIEELRSELANLKGEGDAEAARRDASAEVLAKANRRILRSEVKAAAAGKLADPNDALHMLDLDQFEVDDDGNVDEDEIATAIADLLEKKPYLAAQRGPKAPKPDRSQGARGAGAASTAQQFADAIPL